MATCEIETREREVVVKKTEEVYLLELSREEAEVLSSIFYRVGGNPSGPRGLVDNVKSALQKVGVQGDYHAEDFYAYAGRTQSINFPF